MNKVKCHHCLAVIESKHRHDFVACNCVDAAKRICVDGGDAYSRRVAGTKASFEEILVEAPAEKIIEGLTKFRDDLAADDAA